MFNAAASTLPYPNLRMMCEIAFTKDVHDGNIWQVSFDRHGNVWTSHASSDTVQVHSQAGEHLRSIQVKSGGYANGVEPTRLDEAATMGDCQGLVYVSGSGGSSGHGYVHLYRSHDHTCPEGTQGHGTWCTTWTWGLTLKQVAAEMELEE